MESALDFHSARALLEWQIEFGVDEAISDAPVNRFEVHAQPPKAKAAPVQMQAQAQIVAGAGAPNTIDPVQMARAVAQEAGDLSALRSALGAFDLCDLKKGARNLVFADGVAGAPVMIIGDAPGRDEDREGRPFAGRAGALLDKMLGAIELERGQSVYLSNVLPWRPPQSRDPKPEEIAMMLPFLERHVALARPKLIVLMGNIACQAVLGKRGITRLRGEWTRGFDTPILPMFSPDSLLRVPERKRESWADLLELKARLGTLT